MLAFLLYHLQADTNSYSFMICLNYNNNKKNPWVHDPSCLLSIYNSNLNEVGIVEWMNKWIQKQDKYIKCHITSLMEEIAAL